jgi:hypothetical protein
MAAWILVCALLVLILILEIRNGQERRRLEEMLMSKSLGEFRAKPESTTKPHKRMNPVIRQHLKQFGDTKEE